MKNSIPSHWQIKKLGEIGEIISGGTPSTKIMEYWNGTINWITPADLTDYKEKIIYSGRKCISELGLKKSSARIMPSHSVLFSSRAPIGYVAIAGSELCTNQGFKSIIPNKTISSDFLYYFLKSSKQDAEKVASGTTFKEISLKAFSLLEIPTPPFPEQLTIVSKIEELFSELDKGVESLKTAQQQLKVYRQSLLKAAFEGKLTNENVKEVELPEGWKWVKLNDVCHKIQDGSHFSPKNQFKENGEGRFKYITAKNIRNGYMDLYNVIYTDSEFHNSIFSRCNPEFGDVLLTKDGVNTGEVTLNSLKESFSLLSSVCLLKTKSEKLSPGFLMYYIQSPIGSKNLIGDMTGTAIKRIILRKIKETEIVLPSLKEQYVIISELESKLTICDKMEESISQSLLQAETLKQSILKRAFEGRLV